MWCQSQGTGFGEFSIAAPEDGRTPAKRRAGLSFRSSAQTRSPEVRMFGRLCSVGFKSGNFDCFRSRNRIGSDARSLSEPPTQPAKGKAGFDPHTVFYFHQAPPSLPHGRDIRAASDAAGQKSSYSIFSAHTVLYGVSVGIFQAFLPFLAASDAINS